ncbi:cytochrome c biogenesis protein CcdC [Bacillus sp. sid0103]|uniref:CcdC protein domain-containing protein n=1 Tax=Bacillus sp. sid0103 TaxID=2856337 RepID=UPI001C4441EE|nr:CcdC protein domain-containing protein [Bacillus sp. sid0103]MBV7508742.1 cytochrome c biogenesis protein CcdC [Bacillus sp. sid0103]
MNIFVTLVIVLVIIGFVLFFKVKGRNNPIKRGGLGIITPVLFLLVMFSLSISQLLHIPGEPFHLPAYWEILIAALLGTLFGVIMLTQTSYEIRADGLIYSKPNKTFKYVIITIIIIRIALSQYFKSMDYIEFTVLTMVLAFLYICVWRIGSYLKFRKLYVRSRLAETK